MKVGECHFNTGISILNYYVEQNPDEVSPPKLPKRFRSAITHKSHGKKIEFLEISPLK
jgi:hypothetical protein